MKPIMKMAATTTVLLLMLIVDIPLMPVELVPEAQAIFGVRRRTAIIAYSAGAARGSAEAAASQQQAAASQQQAAAAQQEAAAAQQEAAAAKQQLAKSTSAVPIGTVVETLPEKCIPVTVGNTQYQDCNGTFYKAAFQGNKLVYVSVEKPL